MFREFELVIWSCFSKPEQIKKIVTIDDEEDSTDVYIKKVLNHLINTAYYCKRLVTTENEFMAYYAFFNNYFQTFEGKHTDWLLLDEPDVATLSPESINNRF